MRFGFFIFLVSFLSFFPVFAQDESDPEYFTKPFVPRIISEPPKFNEPLTREEQEELDRIAEEMLSVPAVLRDFLLQPIAKEDYMTRVMRFLRMTGGEAYRLTLEDLAKKKETALIGARRQQLSMITRYDMNLDAQITFEEFERASSDEQIEKFDKRLDKKRVEELTKRRLEEQIKPFRQLDTNEDQVLSYQEMGTLSPQKEEEILQQHTSTYLKYLELDPNNDGVLTVQELEDRALAVFAFFDKNADGYVSEEENETYAKVVAMYQLADRTPSSSCTLDPVPKDLTLLGIGIQAGLALSTVTAMGQEQETKAVNVSVGDDRTPLYLIVSSNDPTIWRFTGNTDAIKHIAVSSGYQNENQKSGSGVTGIPKERVTFISQRCFPYFNEEHAINAVRGRVRRQMGRFPDAIRIGGDLRDVVISDGYVTFAAMPSGEPDISLDPTPGTGQQASGDQPVSDNPIVKWEQLHKKRVKQSSSSNGHTNPYNISTPAGYDAELWGIFLRRYPAGLAEIDPVEVVSDMPAKSYEVLPQMAGLVKLVAEGALVKISENEFLITRDIARFPPGMIGGYSAKFVIASGVRVPAGDPGSSCVMMEEAGEIVDKGTGCN